MDSKDIYERFYNYVNTDTTIQCTQTELNEFLMYGLLLDVGNKYITREMKDVNIDIIKSLDYNFDINLNNILNDCQKLSKENNVKRIYCMSERCYNNYMEQGFIITKDNKQFYRQFDKELWLVHIIQ